MCETLFLVLCVTYLMGFSSLFTTTLTLTLQLRTLKCREVK